MDNNNFWQFYNQHRGKIIGGLCGLVLALFIINYGFFTTLLIAAFVAVGAYFGSRRDNRERVYEFIKNLVEGGKEK